MAGKISSKYGVPALLLPLSVGMLCGVDAGLKFDNIPWHKPLYVALCIILFDGGMNTRFDELTVVQGTILATVGVFLTLSLQDLGWWIFGLTKKSAGIGLLTSLLLAATMSSTDSASVFPFCSRSPLKICVRCSNLRAVATTRWLMFGYHADRFNKMAVRPTIGPGMLLLQLCIGAVAGFAFGKLALYIINRLKLGNASLYPILVLTFCIFIFSATYFMKGNGYLAVYIGGLIIGNHSFQHKRSTINFFDGLTWLFQLLMFLTLVVGQSA